MRVLVVDDNATYRESLGSLLSGWHMLPKTVAAPEEAFLALREAAEHGQPFLFLLLDADLSTMPGMDVAAAIARDPSLPKVTVIMLSSSARVPATDECERAGIAVWLEKPLKHSELRDALLAAPGAHRLFSVPAPRPRVERTARSLRVLLAEDNRVNQELALGLLELAGHSVTVVSNGREAVDRTGHDSFDVVLMDVQMPEVDGFAATAMIRAREQRRGRHTPIIAMTAHAMQGDRERCLEAGMDGYMSKPIRGAVLLETIDRLVRDHVTPSAPPAQRTGMIAEGGTLADAAGDRVPVLDADEALAQCLGNPALLRKILVAFLDHLPRMHGAITQALAERDLDALTRASHTLKGTAGNISAQRVFEVARILEQSARAGALGEAADYAEELERELLLLERAVHASLETCEHGTLSGQSAR
jgi:CheY-like chemotaxis protein/HPt (histidine-containing phosphotransfer) domain-containing protein